VATDQAALGKVSDATMADTTARECVSDDVVDEERHEDHDVDEVEEHLIRSGELSPGDLEYEQWQRRDGDGDGDERPVRVAPPTQQRSVE
jgi:hypothetical protein